MIQRAATNLAGLYESDETAWLEAMADLVQQGRWGELDYPHLGEYLSDMARRDRREVESHMTTLLEHLLKWRHQPERRSRSWARTIVVQQQELAGEASGGVLRNHAEAVLPNAYAKAIKRAAAATGLPPESFPAQCPDTLEQLLSVELPGSDLI